MRNHPPDCVFAPNAVENIIEYVARETNLGETGHSELVNRLVEGFELNEIYCPHEGIDRRDQYENLSEEVKALPKL